MIEVWSKPHPITTSALNIKVGALAKMPRKEVHKWAADVRDFIASAYSDRNIPPHDGTLPEARNRDLQRLATSSSASVLVRDELTGEKNVLAPRPRVGAFCRDLFPHLCESGDGNADGLSLSDYLLREDLRGAFVKKVERLLWQDRMFHLAPSLPVGSPKAYSASNGHTWLRMPRVVGLQAPLAPFWCEATASKNADFLTVSEKTLSELIESGHVDESAIRFGGALGKENTQPADSTRRYLIRTYKNANQRVFPLFFSILTSGIVNQGTNFPPSVSKFLIERFAKSSQPGARVTVLDPSAGYGGRFLGAMAAAHDGQLTYIAVDPNTKNWRCSHRSRYADIADLYNSALHPYGPAELDAFCSGSETVAENPRFQRYRNRVDLAITSPPYFCAEIYSREPTQSAIKFPTYAKWRDGFLRPTLQMCAEYLRPGGYLVWNIADVMHRGKYVPLEQDSCRAILECGLEHVDTLKLLLATVSGANKVKSGLPTTKNFVRVNGAFRKCEPVFVFRKPGA